VPYYITQKSEDCPNWAVVKQDGELIACHDSKQSAIDQAVAISLAEKTDFLGERAAVGSLNVGDWVSWSPLDPTVLGQVEMVQDQFAVVEIYEYEKGIFATSQKYMLLNVFKLEKVQAPAMLAVELEDEPSQPEIEDEGEANLPDNYRPALSEDVPEGRACGNCFFYDESRLNAEGDKAWCERWDAFVDGGSYCNAWQANDEDRALPDALMVSDFVSWNSSGGRALGKIERIVRDGSINIPNSDFTITGTEDDPAALIVVYREVSDGWLETATKVGHKFSTLTKIDDLPLSEERAINQEAPAYMRAAARRGLEYYEQGLAGDGVTPGTIRDARAMATGEVSDDKWVRIAAWIARHLVDLDSPDANPESDNYPSAGVVAHLLWGSGPTKRAAQRTKDYADSVVARIRAEETNSMDNKNKWLDVARAIQLKIDGPQPESKEPEVRVNSTKFEVRAEGDGMTFTGYASVFNSPSEDLGGFIEYVAPGAFKRSLQSRNEVKLLWNHDSGEPLASLRGGTMQLVEDEVGLKVTAQLPNTSRGRDVAELLRTKVIDSMSFGFNVIKDSWSRDGQTRTLESVRLFETSIVSFPAYSSTTATVRSAQPTINADDLAEALLKLESGEKLDEASAELITVVVNKLKADPGVEEVIDNGLDLLDLKKKQFDLLLKRI
jgi:HK97 family phage prohead protease